jgi:hypothetical protein
MATGQVKLYNQKGGYASSKRTSAVMLYSSAQRHVLSHHALGIESDTACASIRKRSAGGGRDRAGRDGVIVCKCWDHFWLGPDGAHVPAPRWGPQGHAGSGALFPFWLQWE